MFSNPRYVTEDNTAIDVDLTLPSGQIVPFTATSNDVEPFGRGLFAQIVAAGGVAAYVALVKPAPKPLPTSGVAKTISSTGPA